MATAATKPRQAQSGPPDDVPPVGLAEPPPKPNGGRTPPSHDEPAPPAQVIPPAPRSRQPMMIKGLSPALPERGKIKIGMKGAEKTSGGGKTFQLPQKLDHFIITTVERGPDGNFKRDETLHKDLGEKPTEIPVRLLYDDPVLNFPTRYACFRGRSLWCSGDGETATRMTKDGPQEVRCPCERQDPTYQGNDKCKMNGALSAIIEGAGGIGGVWKFRTTSYNSIVGILSSMAFIRSVTGGPLANIPLKLTVRPKQATTPEGQQQTIYVVGLEYEGDMTTLQEAGHHIALDRAKTHVAIQNIEEEARRLLMLAPPNVPLPGDDAEEVVGEFYPEQLQGGTVDPNAPPRPRRGTAQTVDAPQPATPPAPEPEPAPAPEPRVWTLVDHVGDTIETHPSPYKWAEAFCVLLGDLADKLKASKAILNTYLENNAETIKALSEPEGDGEAADLVARNIAALKEQKRI